MSTKATDPRAARRVILASQSPQRKNLFATLGVPFETQPADLDEKSITAADAFARAQLLAQLKGQKIQAQYPDAIVIAADTYCFYDGQIFEKPENLAEARVMLTTLAGNTFTDITGFFYHDPTGPQVCEVMTMQATMRPLSRAEIDRYVTNNPVTTWSGSVSPAYIEGAALFSEIHGNLTIFMHGLPIDRVAQLFKESGVLQ